MTTHTIETINACEKRISVTVDAQTIKKITRKKVLEKTNALKKSNKLNYGGFRPHSPATHQLVSKSMTPAEEAEIQRTIYSNSLSSICTQEKISHEGTPLIQESRLNEDGSLSYVASLEMYPTVSHVHWDNVPIEKIVTQITEEALEQTLPLLEKMGLGEIAASKEATAYWCEWMISVFEYQRLREQITKVLPEQNAIDVLPQRVLEARYQELKQESQGDTATDEALREKAERYIKADILFKAYALEHNITLDREILLQRIEKDRHNPFIMSHVKEASQLPYYLAPRVFEEAVIDHLVAHSKHTTTTMALPEFMRLAFNLSEAALDTAPDGKIIDTDTSSQSTSQEEKTA